MTTNVPYTGEEKLELAVELAASHPELRVELQVPVDGVVHRPHIPMRLQRAMDLASEAPRVQGLRVSVFGRHTVPGPRTRRLERILEEMAAQQAIEQKARELTVTGPHPGGPLGDMEPAGRGFVRRYAGCDIYYSPETGAHEVHGEIRAKYTALGGPRAWGLPTTDEQPTPRGAYSVFERGSIYWTRDTGPMMVEIPVRDLWGAEGAENGRFGFPVQDTHVKRIDDPIHNPVETWNVFENGALYSRGNQTAEALVANLPPHKLASLVRDMLDAALKAVNNDLGIKGGARILHVSPWGYGFWASQPRRITLEVHGFLSIAVLPDPTFRIEMTLDFELLSALSFTEPVEKTLVANLRRLTVDTSGVGNGELNDRLVAGILEKFKEPLAISTIPAAALLMDVILTAAGGLQFLLEPDITNPLFGRVRLVSFQQQLDAFVPD